jgi:hypothetical protein
MLTQRESMEGDILEAVEGVCEVVCGFEIGDCNAGAVLSEEPGGRRSTAEPTKPEHSDGPVLIEKRHLKFRRGGMAAGRLGWGLCSDGALN